MEFLRIFLGALILLVLPGILLTACSEDSPEITIEQRLESIAGEDLTPAEIERQLEVASTLCATDPDVLKHLWTPMSARQLRFQDFVFGTHCPQRSVEYAVITGRSLTAEAHSALNAGAGTATETDPVTDEVTDPTTPSTLSLPTPTP